MLILLWGCRNILFMVAGIAWYKDEYVIFSLLIAFGTAVDIIADEKVKNNQ